MGSDTPNQIIKQLCKDILLPLGVFQKGTSRTYIDDNGESTDMDFLDYVEEYGYPSTQFANMLLSFNIYILE